MLIVNTNLFERNFHCHKFTSPYHKKKLNYSQLPLIGTIWWKESGCNYGTALFQLSIIQCRMWKDIWCEGTVVKFFSNQWQLIRNWTKELLNWTSRSCDIKASSTRRRWMDSVGGYYTELDTRKILGTQKFTTGVEYRGLQIMICCRKIGLP